VSDKSLATFQASIHAACRGLWTSQTSPLEFSDQMYSAIRRGFESAWTEGSKSCGILATERTQEETKQLGLMIGDNFQYVAGLADWIYQHSKANGGSWESVVSRSKAWINRYEEVKNVAMTMACKNRKLAWRLGNAEHCRSCIKLSGRIHRSDLWAAKNLAPRVTNGLLKCGGYRCACRFEITDEPATRGRFPNLP
jgi:hypothetical protein